MLMTEHPSVAILQESLENYRIRFFDLLYEMLAERNIRMILWVHETGIPSHLPSRSYIKPLRCLGKGFAQWALLPAEARQADLLIQPQQVRHLSFLLTLLIRKATGRKNAFWGHGRCFDPNFERRWSEKLKRWFSVRVDWWFAYNDLSARIVNELGFPADRITSVMNATDTAELRVRLEEVRKDGLNLWRKKLGVGIGPVGVFTGRLYVNKRVEFTLSAAIEIRKRIPTFEMIFIGDGEDRPLVETAVREHPWIHYPGPKNNADKVPYWAVADVLLNPGVVGLVINDAMALGLPTITTDYPTHSPEIDYLRDGLNGIITRPWTDVAPFAEAVVRLLQDPQRLAAMSGAAYEDGNRFSAEIMAENFANGIMEGLAAGAIDQHFLKRIETRSGIRQAPTDFT
jgi:glycosyltransferase involved in cell wall biosynthesis